DSGMARDDIAQATGHSQVLVGVYLDLIKQFQLPPLATPVEAASVQPGPAPVPNGPRLCLMNPKRHVASLIMDETTRTFRPTMGVARSLLPTPATQARRSVEGRSPDAQRHLLAAQHRRPLARLARALRPLADRLRPLLADARKRLARPDHPTLA